MSSPRAPSAAPRAGPQIPPAAPSWTPAATAFARAGILAAVAAVYANSLHGPFVFDDLPAIRDNPSLQHLSSALFPPSADGNTVGGRPLLNLSFAINHAIGGLDVRGYHVVNALIHCANALLVHAVLRRVLARRATAHGDLVALVTAALWAVHPLATAAVTYLAQRAESLGATCILLAAYGFLRGAAGPRGWLALSAVAAFAGAATKETAGVTPLLILLLDRTLFTGGFAAAMRARPAYYLALAGTWLLLAALVASTEARGGSVGAAGGITVLGYLATQCRAIMHYLQLACWPHPLVFDHGSPIIPWSSAWPGAVLLALAGAWAAWSAHGRRLAGLGALAILILLAPSSSFLPIASQTIAEHRMYLPLALVLALIAAGAARLGGRVAAALLVLALPLGWATRQRNEVFRSAETLWAETVAGKPHNPRAHNNLGLLLAEQGRDSEARRHFETAVGLSPDNPEALNNLGNVLRRLGLSAEAIPHYKRALRLAPDQVATRLNLAATLHQTGRPAEAAAEFAAAAALKPLSPDDAANHGAALLAAHQPAEAIAVLAAAVRDGRVNARTHFNLGNACAAVARWADAIRAYRDTLALQPDHLPAHANLAQCLLITGQPGEAAAVLEQALRLKPGDPQLEAGLARARAARR